MITIVDYGMGNLFSVEKAFRRLNIKTNISSIPKEIQKSDKIVLPGVGHFKKAMENLRKYDLINVLNEKVVGEKVPTLGICLGMQLFTNYSEEGSVDGLGWFDATTEKFPKSKLKIPHIGWNNITTTDVTLFKNLNIEKQFYFVHSYYVKCNFVEDVLSKTDYIVNFHSAINRENIYGVQFHPEKSHLQGLQILKNFSEII